MGNFFSEHVKYVIGLGNPGSNYKYTLHNLGFILVDYLLSQCTAEKVALKHSDIWKTHGLILCKPKTYMNLSGQALKELKNMSKLQPYEFVRSILVVHDDVGLDMYQIRYKDGTNSWGLGGHNGLRSIVGEFGNMGLTKDNAAQFDRLRLGCSTNYTGSLADHVLKSMTKAEVTEWVRAIDRYFHG